MARIAAAVAHPDEDIDRSANDGHKRVEKTYNELRDEHGTDVLKQVLMNTQALIQLEPVLVLSDH